MAEIIATFADGRLLVQESKAVEYRYMGSGVPFRIGHVKTIEKVLSIDNSYAKWGLVTALSDVTIGTPGALISGSPAERSDHLRIIMRRGDIGVGVNPTTASGLAGVIGASGTPAMTLAMACVSALGWMSELTSGEIGISGLVKITANVIAR